MAFVSVMKSFLKEEKAECFEGGTRPTQVSTPVGSVGCLGGGASFSSRGIQATGWLQGYLAHKKTPPPRTLQ